MPPVDVIGRPAGRPGGRRAGTRRRRTARTGFVEAFFGRPESLPGRPGAAVASRPGAFVDARGRGPLGGRPAGRPRRRLVGPPARAPADADRVPGLAPPGPGHAGLSDLRRLPSGQGTSDLRAPGAPGPAVPTTDFRPPTTRPRGWSALHQMEGGDPGGWVPQHGGHSRGRHQHGGALSFEALDEVRRHAVGRKAVSIDGSTTTTTVWARTGMLAPVPPDGSPSR